MARSYTEDEWELKDIPRKLNYEAGWFDNPVMDKQARIKHAGLLARQVELKTRIRRDSVLDRWVMRKYRERRGRVAGPVRQVLTPMLVDEMIEDGQIVDRGD